MSEMKNKPMLEQLKESISSMGFHGVMVTNMDNITEQEATEVMKLLQKLTGGKIVNNKNVDKRVIEIEEFAEEAGILEMKVAYTNPKEHNMDLMTKQAGQAIGKKMLMLCTLQLFANHYNGSWHKNHNNVGYFILDESDQDWRYNGIQSCKKVELRLKGENVKTIIGEHKTYNIPGVTYFKNMEDAAIVYWFLKKNNLLQYLYM